MDGIFGDDITGLEVEDRDDVTFEYWLAEDDRLGPLLACRRGRRVVPTSEPDKRLRAELAAELGYFPASLDGGSIARYRVDAGCAPGTCPYDADPFYQGDGGL